MGKNEAHSTFRRLAKRYRTPRMVQEFLNTLEYNREAEGATLRSALMSIQAGQAHCLEGAFVAAAILEVLGFPPLILDLESKDGLDHVVFVFREGVRWGAIGRSRDPGLAGRAPRFRSIKDLAFSYFDPYIDGTGRLKGYQLIHLDETRCNWRTSQRNVWKAEHYLLSIPHKKLSASKKRYEKVYQLFKNGKSFPPQSYWW